MQGPTKKLLGIVGGMGAEAGVYLQQLIIDSTPVEKDQDHVPVICYTNPDIPDRTQSLLTDNGDSFVSEIVKSCAVLNSCNVDLILIPCNTAFSRFDSIQSLVSKPILHMPKLLEKILKDGEKVGILATNGSRKFKVFESAIDKNIDWIYPTEFEQAQLMEVIYDTKKAKNSKSLDVLKKIIESLRVENVTYIIFGCTELSLYYNELNNIDILDPLRIMAVEAVKQSIE